MDTKFLTEDLFAEAELEFITEGEGKEKNLYLVGTMMQAGVKNRNGRMYSPTDLSEAVKQINARIKNKESVMGELDHPPSLNINLDRVSHIITEATMDGNNAIGKLKILDTPMGKIVKTLSAEPDLKLGVSSRGTGSVGKDGNVSNFVFSTMDIVATPSAPGAYPESVMEALNIAMNSSHEPDVSLTESIREDKDAQQAFKKALLSFVKGLK